MNKNFKKLLSAALSLAMVAGSMAVPIMASADDTTPIFAGDTVIKEWKFDFGAAGATPESGFTLVTPDVNFAANTSGSEQYGFLGTDPEDHNLTNRYDGWKTQKGQTIELAAGNDAIGVVGAGGTEEKGGKGNDIFGNQADKYYPTRFALKVQDDTYYRIRATVTTLDPTKPATASLYTERKHPLYTEKTIAAGESVTTEFSVRVTPICYEKSTPVGVIADEMVTVGVLGENSALASVEIQQVDTIPTVWVLGDSTVTDGNTTLPFFPLQNYTGVGTGLTKYLRRDYAMVNEGEGGLNATDNNHFNMVKNRIKAGDYMYVEYGHNHKDDGPTGYKACLGKYYDACHSVGAKLLVVSPVQSVNSWNENTKRWDSRFGGDTNFEGAGRSFVAEKIAAGATDIAFVNLTTTSVAFVDKVTADNDNKKEAAMFYYYAGQGGGTDASHPNDTGAENFANCFFDAAKEVTDTTQAAVVADLIANMTSETPNLVPKSVMDGGLGGTAWPSYTVPSSEKYPIKIDDIAFNEDGTVDKVDVTVRAAEITFDSYGIIIITINNEDGTEKGKLYAVDQVDNSTGLGPQTVEKFRAEPEGLKLEEGDTYSALVVQAADTNDGLQVVDGGKTYSAIYKPTDIAEHLLKNERNDEGYENFDYYGATYDGKTTDYIGFSDNGWSWIGSAARTSFLNESGGTKYVTFTSDGGGSFYPVKNLAKAIGSSGRYMFSADLQYMSGEGMTFKLVTGHDDKHRGGTESLVLFTVGKDGKISSNGRDIGTISSTGFTNVQYILDIDEGTATVSVGGNEVGASAPVEFPLTGYQTTALTVSPSKLTQILLGEDRKSFSVSVANLMVAKLKDKELPKYTATVTATDEEHASVSIDNESPLKYADGKAIVNVDEALKPVLIEASYSGKNLSGVKITKLNSGVGEVSVAEGSKLMLWNTMNGLEPLTKAITAEESDGTYALNTVMTTSVTVDDGYAFMGWFDSDNNNVSMDENYKFRLRGDTALTAKIVKEPGVEDITSFDLNADKMRANAVAGTTINVNITNAKDAAGTPISKVTNEDVTWSCDDNALTVTNGVVTIPEGYTIDEVKKTVTVTGTLNEVSKSVAIKLYSADYYEDFSTVTDVNAWITSGSTNSLNAIIDTTTDNTFAGMTAVGNGKACVIGNNSNGAGKKLEYERSMGLSEHSVLKFGFEIEPHQIRTDGKDASVTLQFVDSDGATVFNISVHTGGKDSSFNGTAVNGFVQGTAVAVDTELDFENSTMKYTITNGAGKSLASGTATLTAKNLDKMYFSGDWQYGKFAIDNIYADYE